MSKFFTSSMAYQLPDNALHIGGAKPARIVLRDGQRCGRSIHRQHGRQGPLQRQRNGDRAAASTEIKNAAGDVFRQLFQRGFNQQFRIWTRNQDIRRDLETETVKLALGQYVGNRFAVGSAGDQALDGILLRSGKDIPVVRDQPGAFHVEGAGDQYLRFQAGFAAVQVECNGEAGSVLRQPFS
jgi:hypothetical protein